MAGHETSFIQGNSIGPLSNDSGLGIGGCELNWQKTGACDHIRSVLPIRFASAACREL